MAFTHFHVHSQYSILDGAASVPGLVEKAIADGMKAISLTDHGNMFGIKLFYDTCRKKGIKPILGVEAYVARVSLYNKEKPVDRSGEHLIILAKNLKGYLMLVTGDVDNNVHPANTLRMADALLKAGKNFDLVILPGQAHGFMGIQQAFYQRKMWFHFAKHLLGDYSSDQFREIDAYMRL